MADHLKTLPLVIAQLTIELVLIYLLDFQSLAQLCKPDSLYQLLLELFAMLYLSNAAFHLARLNEFLSQSCLAEVHAKLINLDLQKLSLPQFAELGWRS